MKKLWSNGRIIYTLSDEDHALFADTEYVSVELLNKKINLLFDMLTEIPGIDAQPADKGIMPQAGENTDKTLGQFVVQQTLKNAEVGQQLDTIGQGIVQLMLKGVL